MVFGTDLMRRAQQPSLPLNCEDAATTFPPPRRGRVRVGVDRGEGAQAPQASGHQAALTAASWTYPNCSARKFSS
jgi:hypothetical protein